ncbi:thioredoxin domain-containing protein PLP3B isoform X2 [Manihot esculenta]|uniref:thioredoxin domain-containing protein PLP3B isoform X2 n=1 Tax=Manihot esculenta TaxID=3983 RepID=UPI000B5D32C5|nr:thioredoxin domain-containing protein PLP3B isoform X2 [Manihot esculenta]
MDPDSVKSTLSNLAFGNVMAAAARDYQKDLIAQGKAQPSSSINQEVDLDELMDDPELEKLHADRIAALKKEVEKREALKKQGHGEYREISEGDFLGEVTGSEKVICHFYHREFYRCKKGIAIDRLIGFQDLGGKDDFTTKSLEILLIKKGIISEKKDNEDDEEDDYPESRDRTVRASACPDSDSD